MNSSSMTDDGTRFDVRGISCRIKHGQIFQRCLDLPVGAHFVLINDHDPVPLYHQFAALFPGAFGWEYVRREPDEVQVRITKLAAVAMPEAGAAPKPAGAASAADIDELDVRGLEPPEPLVRILNALEALPSGRKLCAITDREPCHLFGEAEQRGFRHACNEQPDGRWVTVLERA